MKMDSPANYRIIVQGRLEADWAERVGGMAITSTEANGEVGATTLEGRLEDQAALAGLLIALYELHLPLVLVEYLDEAAA
jgi:hypothetical protein